MSENFKEYPTLFIVIPCYNEKDVLPTTAPQFLAKLEGLVAENLIAPDSRILFVNDGSKDETWDIIKDLAAKDVRYKGISLSRNRGHQNALLAGLMTAKESADITISIDCDGQDDINAMDEMLKQYHEGCDIVYGVRSSRKTDTFFKRTTAQGFYKFMKSLGVETVYNHADYRLMSKRALEGLAQFDESNLFLRGMVPLVGYKTSSVSYERNERIAGKSHYSIKKMFDLAVNGITSMSTTPLRIVAKTGFFLTIIGAVFLIVAMIKACVNGYSDAIAYLVGAISFVGGLNLFGIGIVGEYIGKIYNDVKRRPRFIISEDTDRDAGIKDHA